MVAFSVNFLMAYATDCSISTVLISEEKKSDGEPESEKESENKLEDFYSEVYSTFLSLSSQKGKLHLSSKNCGLYTSFYSKIATPPPQV